MQYIHYFFNLNKFIMINLPHICDLPLIITVPAIDCSAAKITQTEPCQ